MAKTKTYTSMRIPAAVLAQRIVTFLQEHKYEVSYSADEAKKSWCMIQARKFSKLRTATGNRRSLDIALRKNKNVVKITISSGQWGKKHNSQCSSNDCFSSSWFCKLYVVCTFFKNV